MTPALLALSRADFTWTDDIAGIWNDPAGHVALLHADVADRIMAGFAALPAAPPPLGRVVVGPQGAGKTHLMGTLRRQVWAAGGWFVLLEVAGLRDFWETAAQAFVDALVRPMPDGRTQGAVLLARLAERHGRRGVVAGLSRLFRREMTPEAMLGIIRGVDPHGAIRHRNVALAALELAVGDLDRRDLAYDWLLGGELEEGQGASFASGSTWLAPRAVVHGLAWLMSLGGPTMCAVDQVDAIIAAAHGGSTAMLETLAGGLMDLRDVAPRTLTVLSALEATWDIFCTRALGSFTARFHSPILLPPILQPEAACQLVEARLAPAYRDAGFVPPYPTWPFHATALVGAVRLSPRDLLMRCARHVDACLDRGSPRELASFDEPAPASAPAVAPTAPVDAVHEQSVEARYDALRTALPLPAPDDERRLAELIGAGLTAWVRQASPALARDVELDMDANGLGARIRVSGPALRQFWFKINLATNPISVLNRLRRDLLASGIDPAHPTRRLIVVRRDRWPTGVQTEARVAEFLQRGGQVLMPDDADLRRFAALERLLGEPPAGLDAWLRTRRPMDASPFLSRSGLIAPQDHPADHTPLPPPAEAAPGPLPSPTAPAPPPSAALPPPATHPSITHPPITQTPATRAAPTLPPATIPLGRRTGDKKPADIPLALLARHVAVIAGSGSGKTVLLRRLVEEAVLAGIPAILLDSNNDLVRMADPWPARPDSFTDEDQAKAERYAALAEVVVWTPGRTRGNPLVLPPLPDFAAVRDDEDEREAAVAMAAAALEPLLVGGGAAASQQKAVLKDALRYLARSDGPATLDALVDLLRDLPPDLSRMSQAPKHGTRLADELLAAQSRNPLLAQAGTPLDPATLLRGPEGRVRVSVVNLGGLDDATRPDFVGRLLMALFSHIRRNPSTDARPVTGLLVMDEAHNFAAATVASPSREATLSLVRQARKYGLGLVFATQAPKDIHNSIITNTTTKLIGKCSAPATIAAAREIMATSGGGADDIGRLNAGTFYLLTENQPKPVRIQAPLCLSHHPASPPPEDEVIRRAAATRP